MGALQLCPDEILLLIVYALKDLYVRDDDEEERARDANWKEDMTDWAELSISSDDIQQKWSLDLAALILTCRRLARFLKPILYRSIVLHEDKFSCRSHPLRSLASDSSLGRYIQNLSIGGFDGNLLNPMFCLPNIHTITITGWKMLEVPPILGTASEHNSPVKHLLLRFCSANTAALEALFKLPAALESLCYEVNVANWLPILQPHLGYKGLGLILRGHRETLRSLRYTKFNYRSTRGSELDLTDYTALRELVVNDLFLFAYGERNLGNMLPAGLEILEIHYDAGTFSGESESRWIKDVPRWKKSSLRRLKVVKLYADRSDSANDSANDSASLWVPSEVIVAELNQVGVELKVRVQLHDE